MGYTLSHSPDGLAPSTINLLNWFGWGMIVVCVLLVVIPYLRGKAELVTSWNFLLLGCAITLGVGTLEAAAPPLSTFEQFYSFIFTDAYYRSMTMMNLVFFLALLAFHYPLRLLCGFAGHRFNKSPEWSSTLMIYICAIGAVVMIISRLATHAVVAQLLLNMSQKAAVFLAAFAFYGWWKSSNRAVWLPALLFVFVVVGLFAMQISAGRRLLMSVTLMPGVFMYWLSWRKLPPRKVLAYATVSLAFVLFISLAYQTFRYKRNADRSVRGILDNIASITADDFVEQVEQWRHILGQDAGRYSLIMKRLVDEGTIEPKFLNSLAFLGTYPIPRSWWNAKPMPIGTIIFVEVLKLPGYTNWGVGMAGHCYYEGGYVAVFVYAAVLAFFVALFDEPVRREPSNPFLLASLGAGSSYMIACIRGDLGVHFAEITECFMYTYLMLVFAKFTVGGKAGLYGRLPAAPRLPMAMARR